MYNKINLMLPTYGRAKTDLPRFIDSAIIMCHATRHICFTFLINKNDVDTKVCINTKLYNRGVEYEILYEDRPAPHLAKFFNQIYNKTKFQSPSTVVTMLGDDMEFLTSGYDLLILGAMNNCGGLGIVYGDDCLSWHNKMCINLFTSRKLVDYLKPHPFMCEMFPREYIDVVWYEIGKKLGILNYLDSVKIQHHHASSKDPDSHDDTRKRLMEQDEEAQENKDKIPEYVDSCVASICKNISEGVDFDIDVIMTVYNRKSLLQETIASYVDAIIKPEAIHIFDDNSADSEQLWKICSKMPGLIFHQNPEIYGCSRNTPRALRYMFENIGSRAVVIIDSDVQFDTLWWIKTNKLFNQYKEKPKFASLNILNLDNKIKKSEIFGVYDVIRKEAWGACGAVITRKFWEKYIAPLDDMNFNNWDHRASMAATRAGEINYVCSPSLIQHTGIVEKTSTPGASQQPQRVVVAPETYAKDFRKKFYVNKAVAIDENVGNKRILFKQMGRYGDIIYCTMIVNMLKERGYDVTWLTIPYYADVICHVAASDRKKYMHTHLLHKNSDWGDLTTEQFRSIYSGYRYYINGQAGSVENHDILMNSGLHIAVFIKTKTEEIIAEKLPDNFIDYLKPVEKIAVEIENLGDKKLAILAPESLSAKSAFPDNKTVDEFYDNLQSEGYFVKILTSKRPKRPFSEVRGRYLYGYTFVQCFGILAQASLYVGNDSGLAWASLYNRTCKKRIYHRAERLLQHNNRYSFIDPLAEDFVVE